MGLNGPDKDSRGGRQEPPDLDEALKRFQEKVKGAFFSRGDKPASTAQSGGFRVFTLACLGALFLWVLSGIFIVDPAEQAVILRFGRYIETVGPGPHWIPRLIESKVVVNMDRVSDYSYSAPMLTRDENLVSVSLAVQYRIGDLREYLFNVASPEESLRQATSSALRQVVGVTTLDQLITEGREAWGSEVNETLVKILDKYKTGIVIVNVSPQPARAPENVQDAFDDAIKAQEDEKRFREQALAYKARVVPVAEGNARRILAEARAFAEQSVLRAKGEVAEFKALLPHYLSAPEVMVKRMYLETMQRVLSATSKIVADNKNVIYLPLDRMTGTFDANAAKNRDSGASPLPEIIADESTGSARGAQRATYRQDRGE